VDGSKATPPKPTKTEFLLLGAPQQPYKIDRLKLLKLQSDSILQLVDVGRVDHVCHSPCKQYFLGQHETRSLAIADLI